jgi:hypothetical protein
VDAGETNGGQDAASMPGADDAGAGAPDAVLAAPDADSPAPDAAATSPDADMSLPDADAPAPDATAIQPDADLSNPDAAPAPDADPPAPDANVPAPDATPALLPFGSACTSNTDCQSNLCFDFPARGMLCTDMCVAGVCPDPSSSGCNGMGVCKP